MAAAPEGAEKDKKYNLSSEANSSSRLYRSALSLNNVDRKNVICRRDDKFLRGSTTSLVNPTREIPIEVTPEVTKRRGDVAVNDVHDDDGDDVSPVRPPRKLKTEKEISKKDLFFDLGASPQRPATSPTRLKSSTSYSELARTSMLNSNYFKGHKYPSSTLNISRSPESPKVSSDDRKSYFFGETSETKTTHFPSDPYADTVDNAATRSSRTPDRRKSPEWISDSYLRVQSEPPLVKGQPQIQTQPQPIREEIIQDEAKVRRIYPTVEKRNSRQSNVVYRSESKREPKRLTLTFHLQEGDPCGNPLVSPSVETGFKSHPKVFDKSFKEYTFNNDSTKTWAVSSIFLEIVPCNLNLKLFFCMESLSFEAHSKCYTTRLRKFESCLGSEKVLF